MGARAIGKGMIVAAWVALLGMLTLLFQQRLDEEENPNRDVAVPEALAERLGLERGAPSQGITANGRSRTWRTRLDEVRLGSIVQKRVSGVIMPNLPGDRVLLGMSFLRSLHMVQQDGVLSLKK